MESWSYISRGGEDFVHNESASATDRNENWLMDSNADFMSSSNQEGTKNSQFVELGYYADDRTPQKPIIDLELGRFPPADHKDVQQGNANNNNPNFSSGESSSMIPAKRIRAGKSSNQIPYCQVYGCKKDLSNCKDYHKRHKVCEIHSKTPKVIVNGIDQRFCQQCSRFHLLAEFDEGKRSCRRRLAGHNERRRKPYVGMHSTRSGRFLPPYTGIGTRFNGPSCFAFPSSSVYRDRQPTYKHELNDHHFTNNVAADGYVPPPPPPPPPPSQHGISYHQMCSSNSEAQSSSFLVHNQDFVDDSTSHHPLFRNDDELTVLTDSNSSSCALSLLSFQSENQNPPPNNKNIPSSSSICSLCPLTQQSTSAISSVIREEEETQAQMEEEEEEPILISDDKYYGMNEFLLVENTENRARNNADGGGSTINLLQLSSQLQQVKQEEDEDTWFGLRIT